MMSKLANSPGSGLSNRMVRLSRRSARQPRRCELEVLEGRQLLSTIAVTNLHRAMSNPRDVVRIDVSSHHQRIKRDNQAANITYYNADNVSIQPVSGWQGIRSAGARGQYLIVGTSNDDGLLFEGTINGNGTSYPVIYSGAYNTSVYGPNLLNGDQLQLVGSYKNPDYSTAAVTVNGFLFQGTAADLPSGGSWTTIDYPGATYNYVHSTMGGLAVGNYDSPTASGMPLGPGKCFIYNIATSQFTNIVFPGSVSDTAYGIWYNGGTSYTICGGYSDVSANNMTNQGQPIGQAYLVDYNAATGQFSHWTSFSDPNGARGTTFVTHFEGISSVTKGVYMLAAMSAQTGSNHLIQGSLVTVRRNPGGTFGHAKWVNLNFPHMKGMTTSDSVIGNQVVGIVLPTNSSEFSYQATVNA